MVPLEIPHAPSTKSVLGTWYRFHHSNNPNVELRLEEKGGLAIVTLGSEGVRVNRAPVSASTS